MGDDVEEHRVGVVVRDTCHVEDDEPTGIHQEGDSSAIRR